MALYFCVRIRVRGGAERASGRSSPRAATPKKFPYLKEKAEGGAGGGRQKLKGNFGVAKLFYLTFSNGCSGASEQRHALISETAIRKNVSKIVHLHA